jgi:hypothetical protein
MGGAILAPDPLGSGASVAPVSLRTFIFIYLQINPKGGAAGVRFFILNLKGTIKIRKAGDF